MKSTAILKGVVRGGHVVVEELVDYQDGTELELEVIIPMDEHELAELDAALAESREQADTGQVRSADEFLADLRAAP